ncbi:MAG: enterobactin exporter EntS [Firmicutes bacterium ADurb.Bin419]|nr:MAG: enterobactin exporter EntS [Firmicutes bacterium ADurb.Bin419]
MEAVKNSKRNFFILWVGQLLSNTGSGLTGFALGVWMFEKTGLATYYALIVLCSTVPGILVRPFAGALADRYSRRLLMVLSDLGAALGTVFVAIMFWTGNLQPWHIYLGMSISSALTGVGVPSYMSAVTQLVPRNFYAQASGMIQGAGSAQYLISPLLAGLLLPVIGITGIIFVDFATFTFATLATLSIRIPILAAKDENEEVDDSLIKQVWNAFLYLRGKFGLMALIIILSIVNFFLGFLISLIGPMVLSFTTSRVLGIGQSISAVGMLLSSILIVLLNEPKNLVRKTLNFLVILGVSYALIGVHQSIVTIVVPCFVFFFSIPFINTYIDIIMRRKVEPHYQGRVYALIGMMSQTGLILSYIISGPLSDRVFEPMLQKDGILANGIGSIIGTGPGRGIALIFIIMGIMISVLALVAGSIKQLKKLESQLAEEEEKSLNVSGVYEV